MLVAAQVMGLDRANQVAGMLGEFELSMGVPLVGYNVSDAGRTPLRGAREGVLRGARAHRAQREEEQGLRGEPAPRLSRR